MFRHEKRFVSPTESRFWSQNKMNDGEVIPV
jgi:hypothetical protein